MCGLISSCKKNRNHFLHFVLSDQNTENISKKKTLQRN